MPFDVRVYDLDNDKGDDLIFAKAWGNSIARLYGSESDSWMLLTQFSTNHDSRPSLLAISTMIKASIF